MPITLPPFVQQQVQSVPVKGNWNRQPKNPDNTPQDDMLVSLELDWPIGGAAAGNAVQLNFSGNSPVALGQITAIVVDNSRCGSDVSFLFPDTGFELTVDAGDFIVSAVLTNAMTFYALAPNAVSGDITVLQVCNTVPPVLVSPRTVAQQQAGVANLPIANGTSNVTTGSGTLTGFSMPISVVTALAGTQFVLQDGTGKILWAATLSAPANTVIPLAVTGLNTRFSNGIVLVQSGVGAGTGFVSPNLYITRP